MTLPLLTAHFSLPLPFLQSQKIVTLPLSPPPPPPLPPANFWQVPKKNWRVHKTYVLDLFHPCYSCNELSESRQYTWYWMNSRGGGTPLYKPYGSVPFQRVGFLRRFYLKTGRNRLFRVWNRLWFSRELRECMNVFIFLTRNQKKKEREICEFEMAFKKSFLLLF